MLVTKRLTIGVVVAAGWVGVSSPGTVVRASTVPFNAAIETLAQSGVWTAQLAIDGNTSGVFDGSTPNGWAIQDLSQGPDPTPAPQTAYFRFAGTGLTLTASAPTLEIQLYQLFEVIGNSFYDYHTLGAFRLSVTGSNLGTFDLVNAGLATWQPLVLPTFTMSSLPPFIASYGIDGSGDILVNNPGLPRATYTIKAKPSITTITGIRLEVLPDPNLPPFNGPGFQPTNGNFVLNEITAAAVPLPAAAGVGFSMLGGFGGLAALRRRLRSKPRIA